MAVKGGWTEPGTVGVTTAATSPEAPKYPNELLADAPKSGVQHRLEEGARLSGSGEVVEGAKPGGQGLGDLI